MSKINLLLREKINNKNKKRLKNKDFSLISSNCNGAFILHDLGLRFNSPFVNLWMKPNDYIKLLQKLEYYLSCEMTFTEESNISYPIGVLDDIKIYFQHYKTPEEAKQKWFERAERIDMNNLFIMFTDRDGCTYQNLSDFNSLPYKNKIVFTNKPYPEFKSAYYLKGWENDDSVGMCFEFKNSFTGKKYYDDFDYIGWFNQENI